MMKPTTRARAKSNQTTAIETPVNESESEEPTWDDSALESTLEDCDSLLVCLNSRRFAVVRVNEPKDLWPVNGGWKKLRQLKPGDEVIYKGDRTTVRALDVYR